MDRICLVAEVYRYSFNLYLGMDSQPEEDEGDEEEEQE